jgi:acyl dehydratase
MLSIMTELLPDVRGVRPLRPDFPVPTTDRYFEDYRPGTVYEYGYASLTEAQIQAFAATFDPQTMHTDSAAAGAGAFGGLIASGWHTAGLFMRLFVDHYLSRVASLGSPGIDTLRWPAPLRPDAPVRMRVSIDSAHPSRSRTDRGLITTHGELVTDSDQPVLTLTAMNLLRRRQPASAAPPTSSSTAG